MNIYIGNFSYDITGDDLQEVFGVFGRVESVKIIRDNFTGESKGFGFVDMPNKAEAHAAILGITEIKGKRVTINEARPQLTRSARGGQKANARSKSFRGERRY